MVDVIIPILLCSHLHEADIKFCLNHADVLMPSEKV